MTRSLLIYAAPILATVLAGCGGAPPPATPSTPPAGTETAKPTPDAKAADGKAADGKALDKHALAEAAAHEDPNEKEGPIDLTALVDKASKPTFPKQTVGDHECLSQIPFSGKHKVDFATIIGKCGTPTGMLEYTKPAEGKLHAKHDKRDEFKVKVQKGMCYRYFAVADDGIKDIDIIILKKGALLATDKTEQAIAIIDTDKLWCADDDMDLQFNIEIDGPGAGGYTFGVWVRPKGK